MKAMVNTRVTTTLRAPGRSPGVASTLAGAHLRLVRARPEHRTPRPNEDAEDLAMTPERHDEARLVLGRHS